MRRLAGPLATGAALAAMALPAVASAAPASIDAGVGGADVFNAASYAHEAGTIATMVHVGGAMHNATATALGPDGKALFRSADILSGSTPVRGTQYLPAGSYPFVCTIHVGMNSTLDVTTGTPQARPTVAVKLTSTKIAKVVKKGKLAANVTLTGGEPATVTAKLGKTKLATATAAKSGALALKLSKSAVSKLAKKKKATIKLDAAVDFGSPVGASGKIK
jgi:plastocyanin